MELFKASQQWMNRPDDERFWTLADMLKATESYRKTATEPVIPQGQLKVVTTKGGLGLLLDKNVDKSEPVTMTHFAFGQLCGRMCAPPDYLRTLSPELAALNLNYCLEDDDMDENELAMLVHDGNGGGGHPVVRSLMTKVYTRIWNSDTVQRLVDLPKGWVVPPARPARDGQLGTRPAVKADLLRAKHAGGLSIKLGDLIAPAGLYASDHDMFAFMVNEDLNIKDGSTDGLSRGFFVWNSEVGGTSWGIRMFLYKSVCGNHIVWGAQDVSEIRIRHVGDANAKAFGELEAKVVEYANSSASDTEAVIKSARKVKLGKDKEEVLDAIFKMKIGGLSKAAIDGSYDVAEKNRASYGDPNMAWGMVNGITEFSQDTPYTEGRVMLDRAAGQLLQITAGATA
jgi:Domain of unknown function (DUF932)